MTNKGDSVEYGAILLSRQYKTDEELDLLDDETDEETVKPMKKDPTQIV